MLMTMTIKIYKLQRTAKLYAEDKENADAVKAACRGPTTVRLCRVWDGRLQCVGQGGCRVRGG